MSLAALTSAVSITPLKINSLGFQEPDFQKIQAVFQQFAQSLATLPAGSIVKKYCINQFIHENKFSFHVLDTALFEAAKNGDVEGLEKLTSFFQFPEQNFGEALIAAVKESNIKSVNAFIQTKQFKDIPRYLLCMAFDQADYFLKRDRNATKYNLDNDCLKALKDTGLIPDDYKRYIPEGYGYSSSDSFE